MKRSFKKTIEWFSHKGVFVAVFLLAVFSSLIFINQAHAASMWWNSAASVVSDLMRVIDEIVAGFIGIFIILMVWLNQFALQLNASIPSLGAVIIGQGIAISLANLGFVTILIIIAIATILRRENYGIKKLLAKLIIAALLVNFSMPIATTIMRVSDQLTYYFLSNFPGGGGNAATGWEKFGTAIGSAFNPQAIPMTIDQTAMKNQVGAITSNSNSTDFSFISSLVSFGFAIIFPLVILISLIALFLMLLIRAIILALLLILMPLAWVTWITPLTEKEWHEWWDKFLKWTFFSPIMMMFLYLAMISTHAMSQLTISGDVGLSLNKYGNLNSDALISIANQVIIIGVLIGGLFAANSMGVKMAGSTLGVAKNIGKGAANWTNKRGTQALTRPLRSPTGQSIIGAMQRSRLGLVSSLGKVAGNLAQTTGGKAEVDEERKKAEKLDDGSLKNLNQGKGRYDATKISYLQELDKRGLLTDADRRGVVENKNKFNQYGAEGFTNKISKQSIWNDDTIKKHKDLEAAQTDLTNGKISRGKYNETAGAFNQAVSDKISGMEEDDQKSLMKSLKSALKNYNIGDASTAGESKASHEAKQAALSVAISNNPTLYNTAVSHLDGASATNVTSQVLFHKIDQLASENKIDIKQAEEFKNKAVKEGNADKMGDLLKTLRASGAKYDELATNIVGVNIGARVLNNMTGKQFVLNKKSPADTRKV